MVQLGNHTNTQLEENMVRHMVLNSLRSYKSKFSHTFGEMVIACDNTNYWRKQIFPYYKANRKKASAKSELDWTAIFVCLNKIRSELKEFSPYRVIDVPHAEADDIIASLIDEFSSTENKILILSGDKDFIQLQTYDNVAQYDPTRKKWIQQDNPDIFLLEHILRGDAGDGIPNVLSSDKCFVDSERQKTLSKKKMDLFLQTDMTTYTDENVKRNYFRNAQLIDLKCVPQEIHDEVVTQYNAQDGRDRSKMYSYLASNKLTNLLEHLTDF